MPDIRIVPLGAGQDVGRSCILVSIGHKNVMFDCGMHMGYNDERRFPDFNYITGDQGTLTPHIDAVIISHFHLDHCGALPYMSEQVGYDGPIYMTMPTKVIAPILLEDFRKVVTRKGGTREDNFFTSEMIKKCMKKVTICGLHQVINVDSELSIKAYYAGHVLGAAMFKISVGGESVLYTGDYNMTPDRHLGAAWADRCEPTVLISESTYATTIRDSKRCRERDFLKKIHSTVAAGGKVLIPVFALGRAQELCILLESYWDRMKLEVPIYFTAGLAEKATNFYKLFVNWTNQKIKDTFVERNAFNFKYIKSFNKELMDRPGPMVCFATPGMLHAGQSLEIFKAWCHDEANCIIMPGYCVAGTVGHRLLHGERRMDVNGRIVTIKMRVEYMSFSAHADAKGIMQLIRMTKPKHVMFVHGEAAKMEFLAKKVHKEIQIPCFTPANGETITVAGTPKVEIKANTDFIKETMKGYLNKATMHAAVIQDENGLQLISQDEAIEKLKLTEHHLNLSSTVKLASGNANLETIIEALRLLTKQYLPKSLVNWVQTTTSSSIQLSSPDSKSAISIVGSGKENEKELLVTWPLSIDTEANVFLSRLQKEFIKVAPK